MQRLREGIRQPGCGLKLARQRVPAWLPGRARLVFGGLALAQALAWLWAFAAFRQTPVLLGTALLAYGLGLRHAVDADHIAAIDNVTRRLMQDGTRPVCVGLYFSLGHSTVVIAASAAIALAAERFGPQLEVWHAVGGLVGTLVSIGFLFAIAVMNLAVLLSLRGVSRRVRAGETVDDDQLGAMLSGGGLIARLVRPLFGMIGRSWHMYPLGVLFGLGFDTATEVALLGLSATEASHRLPFLCVMVFPALFTVGMALVDTADGVLMLGAYGWAFVQPLRRLTYNMVITLVSVLVALLVGGLEAMGLLWTQAPQIDLGTAGVLVIGGFACLWGGFVLAGRRRQGLNF